jgi:outer membrane protein W
MRLLVLGAIVTASLAAAGNALAAPSASGIEIGARLGYQIPLGSVSGSSTTTNGNTTITQTGGDLGNVFSGGVPLSFDAGYRFNPNVYVGAFATYGFLFVNTDKSPTCKMSGVSCSGHQVELGVNLHYHIAPDSTFDPWVGVGFGYEWLTASLSVGGLSGDATLTGFQFVNAQLGGDYKVAPNFGIGPFVMLAVGQFDSVSASSGSVSQSTDFTNKALHEWLSFGVRGAYDINLL